MTEHASSRKLRAALVKNPNIYYWKINDRFTRGIPDAFIEGPTGEAWVESKHLKTLPKRSETIIHIGNLLSEHQKQWLSRRHKNMGDALVLISAPDGWLLCESPAEWEGMISTKEFLHKCTTFQKIVENLTSRVSL